MNVLRDTEEIRDAMNKALAEKFGPLGLEFIIVERNHKRFVLELRYKSHPIFNKFHKVALNEKAFNWIYTKLGEITDKPISAKGHQFVVHRLSPDYYFYEPSGGARDDEKFKMFIERLKTQGFTCEGGPLVNTVEFRELASCFGVELPPLKGGAQNED